MWSEAVTLGRFSIPRSVLRAGLRRMVNQSNPFILTFKFLQQEITISFPVFFSPGARISSSFGEFSHGVKSQTRNFGLKYFVTCITEIVIGIIFPSF